jgi:hypothetical protein
MNPTRPAFLAFLLPALIIFPVSWYWKARVRREAAFAVAERLRRTTREGYILNSTKDKKSFPLWVTIGAHNESE